ncbi:hypothetical protein [Streptomyces violaceorubidus]|uniref:Acyl-CoA dehydrogenase n=1 Tax=Streptomyces violaceorubidus TaxID=284042 RepID=A0ABV1SWA4_9ACTN
MAAFTQGDPPSEPGPGTGLGRVLTAMEPRGHADPAAAWRAFTGAWNWAAPLTAAAPGPGLPGAAAVRPAPGGFDLSGVWHLPPGEAAGPWLALPLASADHGCGARASVGAASGADDCPDLFVLPARTFERRSPDTAGGPDGPGPTVLRLEGVRVPTGLATYTAGTALRAQDAAFLWTAVAALALGAARRMTDVLAGQDARVRTPGPGLWAEAGPAPLVAAELAAALHDERLALTATLHGAPTAREGLPPALRERLAVRVRRLADTVHHVLAAAYDHVLLDDRDTGRRPLVSVLEASSPILQQVRYATELLPPHDRMSLRKAERGDDRRISG